MGVDGTQSGVKPFPVNAACIPTTPEETAALLQQAVQEKTVLAFSQAEASLLAVSRWLDCSALKAIRHDQPDDFMVRVQTGVTLGELNACLAPHNQVFPLSYPAHVTIGDILAEDRPSLETGLRGYPRDYVLKTQIATPDGQLTTSGADVVKNVTGYDLHKLYIGAYNAFGVMTASTLKIVARPAMKKYAFIHGLSLAQAQPLIQDLQAAALPLVVCELVQAQSLESELSPATMLQSPAGWVLFIGLATEQALMEGAMAQLDALIRQDVLPHDGKTISLTWLDEAVAEAKNAQHYCDTLQSWPSASVVLEVALPLAHWSACLEAILAHTTLSPEWRFQVRPAASLLFIYWPADTVLPFNLLTDSLAAFQVLAKRFEGFVQLRRLPWETGNQNQVASSASQPLVSESVVTSQWLALTRQYNLPPDSAIRSLLQSIKASYDPTGILFSPYLPLNSVACP